MHPVKFYELLLGVQSVTEGLDFDSETLINEYIWLPMTVTN